MFKAYLLGGPLDGQFKETSDFIIILEKKIDDFKPVQVNYRFLLSILDAAIYVWEDMSNKEAVEIIMDRIANNQYNKG